MEFFTPNSSTPSKCLICLQKLTTTHYSETFRNISRYVKVNTVELYKCSSTTDVNLCADCSILMCKFNQLYGILEETRLRLDHCLQEIVAAMMEADEDVQSSQSSSDYSMKKDSLRKGIINSCVLKLKVEPPHLRLKRMQSPPTPIIIKREYVEPVDEARPEPLFPDDPNDYHHLDCNMPELQEEVTIKIEPMTVQSLPDAELGKNSALADPLVNIPNRAKKKKKSLRVPKGQKSISATSPPAGTVTCMHCLKHFGPAYIEVHYTLAHCEHYLLEHKKENLSSAQFKEIVDEILFPELMEPSKCLVCMKEFTGKKKYLTRSLPRHLLKMHLSVLKKRVIELQNDPEVLENVHADASPKELRVDAKLKPEVLTRIDLKEKGNVNGLFGVNTKIECKCGKQFLPRRFVFHRKRCTQRAPSAEDFGKLKQCLLCKQWMRADSFYRHKKLRRCKALQIESEPGELDTEPPSCNGCGKKFGNMRCVRNHRRYFCPGNPKPLAQCKGCRKWMHKQSLKRHLKNAGTKCGDYLRKQPSGMIEGK